MSDTTSADAAPAAPAGSPPPRRRSRLLRILLWGSVAMLALLSVAVAARNTLLRRGLEEAVTRATGFPLEVASFELGLLDTRLSVRGLHLRNPEGFPDPTCLRVSEMVADPEVASLLGDTVHVEEMTLRVAEVVVVRKADGETNLDRLRALGGGGGGGGSEGGGEKTGGGGGEAGSRGGAGKKFRIDLLRLGIGKVRLVDWSRARDGKPAEETWDLGIDEEFRDLDSVEKVARVIVLRVVQKTNIRLLGRSLDSLASGLGGVLSGSGESVGALLKGIGDASGVGKAVDDGLKGAKDALGGLLGK